MNLTEDQKEKFKRKIERERKVRILLELFGQGLFLKILVGVVTYLSLVKYKKRRSSWRKEEK